MAGYAPEDTVQTDLFALEDGPAEAPERKAPAPARRRDASMAAFLEPAQPSEELVTLASALRERTGGLVRLGTSSWHFPGWTNIVWGRDYAQPVLSKRGLTAYGRHPLLGTVSLDRAFYRPLEVGTYVSLAEQVPPDFRFMVKAPSMVTDALVREAESGKGMEPNPLFLDPETAVMQAVAPAAEGLGPKLGVLVFQLSPLSPRWLNDIDALLDRLDALWQAVMPQMPPGSIVALEVRDRELLVPELAARLKAHGVRYCLGVHDRMPSMERQLPVLRAQWPGPLVCRWNLQSGLKYEQARQRFEPFDKLLAPDEATRIALARAIAGTVSRGEAAFVAINNKAEGSAPLSVIELAKAVLALL